MQNLSMFITRTITPEAHAAALARAGEILGSVRVAEIDALRARLDLPAECFAMVMEIYLAQIADSQQTRASRCVLPIGTIPKHRPGMSDDEFQDMIAKDPGLMKPGEWRTITAEITGPILTITPDRLFVSAAGTDLGAADWLIRDVRIGGVPAFSQPGTIPGDLFASTAIDLFVTWPRIDKGRLLEIDVEYAGAPLTTRSRSMAPSSGSRSRTRLKPRRPAPSASCAKSRSRRARSSGGAPSTTDHAWRRSARSPSERASPGRLRAARCRAGRCGRRRARASRRARARASSVRACATCR